MTERTKPGTINAQLFTSSQRVYETFMYILVASTVVPLSSSLLTLNGGVGKIVCMKTETKRKMMSFVSVLAPSGTWSPPQAPSSVSIALFIMVVFKGNGGNGECSAAKYTCATYPRYDNIVDFGKYAE